MSFLKKKGKWGILVYGYGTVITDFKTGAVVVETEPDKFTNVPSLRFKAIGGWHKSDKKGDDEGRWVKEEMNFIIPSDHPLAPIVKNLTERDYVWCWGKLRKSHYTNTATGKPHNFYITVLEDIQVRYHGNGDLAKPPQEAVAVDDSGSDFDIDF